MRFFPGGRGNPGVGPLPAFPHHRVTQSADPGDLDLDRVRSDNEGTIFGAECDFSLAAGEIPASAPYRPSRTTGLRRVPIPVISISTVSDRIMKGRFSGPNAIFPWRQGKSRRRPPTGLPAPPGYAECRSR